MRVDVGGATALLDRLDEVLGPGYVYVLQGDTPHPGAFRGGKGYHFDVREHAETRADPESSRQRQQPALQLPRRDLVVHQSHQRLHRVRQGGRSSLPQNRGLNALPGRRHAHPLRKTQPRRNQINEAARHHLKHFPISRNWNQIPRVEGRLRDRPVHGQGGLQHRTCPRRAHRVHRRRKLAKLPHVDGQNGLFCNHFIIKPQSKAGNKGFPASSRDGAPIEVNSHF